MATKPDRHSRSAKSDSCYKKLINANATADDIQKQAEAEGMVTMLEDGFIKAAQGITSIEEVLRVITE